MMVSGCTHNIFFRCPLCGSYGGSYGYTDTRVVLSYGTNSYGYSSPVEEFKKASEAALMFLQDLDLCTVSLAELFRPWEPPPARLNPKRYRRAARTRQPAKFSRYRR